MNSEQRLADHNGHALEITQDEETALAALVCNTCGEYIIEQDEDGIVIWN